MVLLVLTSGSVVSSDSGASAACVTSPVLYGLLAPKQAHVGIVDEENHSLPMWPATQASRTTEQEPARKQYR